MPIYEYRCPEGHLTQRIRGYNARNTPLPCPTCSGAATLIISRPAGSPDGIYSFSPNIGDPNVFEQRREAIKAGVRTLPKIRSDTEVRRARDEGLE